MHRSTHFLGFDTSSNETLYIDALSELLNIIIGSVQVINSEQQTELSTPQVERDNDDFSESFTKFLA